MDLLLKGLTWMHENSLVQGDVRIKKGFIADINLTLEPEKRERVLSFSNHYLYPGLINAHDHLEMNLYPKLGHPPYTNFIDWGNDVYKPTTSPIKEIEKVDIDDRLLWGGVKNLISGVTTVVHHNPWKRILSSGKFPVTVLEKFAWSHSLASGKNLLQSFPKKRDVPFIIHAAEGVDDRAFGEIKKLDRLGLLKDNTVLIHAIALTDSDINLIKKAGASIVWCPASNFFLFNQTAAIKKLKDQIPVALGSDSTLSGSATLLKEMQFALQTGLASAEEIFKQVTSIPASIFKIENPQIKIGSKADLLVLPKLQQDYYSNLIHSQSGDVEMVITKGEITLCSESIAGEVDVKKTFAQVKGVSKWFCIDVRKLKSRIQKVAGKAVEANPLWALID